MASESPPITPLSSNVQPSSRQPVTSNILAIRRMRYQPQQIGRILKFEGRCEELKTFVYDSTITRQAEQFTRTTKEIAKFIGLTYKFGIDTWLSIENMTPTYFTMPQDPPDNASKTELRIWEKQWIITR
jgi:hypothetical protein